MATSCANGTTLTISAYTSMPQWLTPGATSITPKSYRGPFHLASIAIGEMKMKNVLGDPSLALNSVTMLLRYRVLLKVMMTNPKIYHDI